ncbi:hypothetical protein GN956_G6363 [Arapaima gigas]
MQDDNRKGPDTGGLGAQPYWISPTGWIFTAYCCAVREQNSRQRKGFPLTDPSQAGVVPFPPRNPPINSAPGLATNPPSTPTVLAGQLHSTADRPPGVKSRTQPLQVSPAAGGTRLDAGRWTNAGDRHLVS